MRELFLSIGVPLCVDEGFLFIAEFKGGLTNNLNQNLSQSAINFQRIHLKLWAKMGMFSFKVFLLFWVIVAEGKSSKKGKYFNKKKIVSLVGFSF